MKKIKEEERKNMNPKNKVTKRVRDFEDERKRLSGKMLFNRRIEEKSSRKAGRIRRSFKS